MRKGLILALVFLVFLVAARGQGNFEIQVYESELTGKNTTMLELHSNFTISGSTATSDKLLPTNHQLNETIEVTHGFTTFLETGFYLFTALGGNGNYYIAGSHIRPRLTAPESWKIPFGFSVSTEIGYLSNYFAGENWSWEIRPILDKRWKKLYIGVNPAVEIPLSGTGKSQNPSFAPSARCSYPFFPKVAFGLEYYGSMGQIGHFDPVSFQQHNLFIAADIEVIHNWEINFGYGMGLNPASDNGIVKLILGYKISKERTTGISSVYRTKNTSGRQFME